MPTLAACAAACGVLLLAVGLQAPAVSVGVRWTPGPRSRTLDLVPFDADMVMELPTTAPRDDRWPSWLTWLLAALVTTVLLVALQRWLRLRQRRAPARTATRIGGDTRPPGEADAQVLQSGLAVALELLTETRDPGNAVVQAWQSLQDAAAAAGLTRRPAETASEFTARILYRSRGSATPIAQLLSLYQRVRFGEHTPSAAEIAVARDALAVLVELWQSDLADRRLLKVVRS